MQNVQLYSIAGLCGLLLLLLGVSIYFLIKNNSLKRKIRSLKLSNLTFKTDLDVARALINPHFIFNSLSALQNFILSKDHEQANDYMIKFSKLVRKLLESNGSNMTTVEQEMLLLKSYLQFKEVNFQGNLRYIVEADPSILIAQTYIPVMMIEPFIESALWHGLLKQPIEKIIRISFSPMQQLYVLCVIDNNGINQKTEQHDPKKKISAADFVKQRLVLLNKIYNLNCTLSIEDKPNDRGTVIKILLPVLKH